MSERIFTDAPSWAHPRQKAVRNGAARLFNFFSPLLRRLSDDHAYILSRVALRAYPTFLSAPAQTDSCLKSEVLGLTFPTPLGIAAGFYKDGFVASKMLHFGAGFVEVGTATPKPQKGNSGTTIRTLEKEQACVNRMGFPNKGIDSLINTLKKNKKFGVIGINISANRDSKNKIKDYALSVEKINRARALPDYITINVSSPNTKGLRQLQELDQLSLLLDSIQTPIPVLLKLSPDMADEAYKDIAQLAVEKNLAGIVATNTTIQHSDPSKGGLSGAPLHDRALFLTRLLYNALGGKLPLIGVGGISTGADAYERICAGASLIQIGTALIWHGPALIQKINTELAAQLEQDGFNTISEAVGTAT